MCYYDMRHFILIIMLVMASSFNVIAQELPLDSVIQPPASEVGGDSAADIDDDMGLSEITDAQLEEAEAMLRNCQSTLKLSRYYDCECYAAKFLDGRIKKGPMASKEEIIETFYSDCRNIIETTGYEYTRCMARTVKRPVKNIEPKDFCECYARQWAKNFEAYDGIVNFSSKNLMKLRARSYCKHRENYEEYQ